MPVTPHFRRTLSSRAKRSARLFNRTGKLRKHQPILTPITEEYNNKNHSPIVHRTRRRLSPIPPMLTSRSVLNHNRNTRGGTFRRRR